jgi:rubrerythrin
MALMYSAFEIYEMGIEIEKNGKKFYSACAQSAESADVKKLCEELSQWETQHVAIFEKLQKDLPDSARRETTFDPDNELGMYLKAAADSHIFAVNTDIAALTSSLRTAGDILGMALSFEKDSVVLYASMLNMVPEHLGKKTIEKIIEEELKHISIITRQMGPRKK